MPKSGSNVRPFNKQEKKDSSRNKKAIKQGLAAGFGNAVYMGVGPGRNHNSAAVAKQATRSLAGEASKRLAQRISVRGGPKPRAKK